MRENAVGHPVGSAGAGSGGDVDTDVVGVGTGVGLAAGGPDEDLGAAEFNSEESGTVTTNRSARATPPAQQGEDADSLDHSGGSDEYSPPSATEQKSFGTGLDDDDIEEDQGE